ncbi:MAG: ABC transporter permease subunit [Victivallaceae bacterium]|nr:ABC transporter permease subunit [Victivallaceae bacterium]
MFNFFHIAKNTFRESLREPIFFILLLTALILIAHFPSMSLFVFREQIKLVVDSAMATTLVFGLFAAVLCASHTVSREMRNGTALLLLSKPVYRSSFILAKIAGIIAALTLFVFICNSATLTAIIIAKDQFNMNMIAYYIFFAVIVGCTIFGLVCNYMQGKSFSSSTIMAMLVTIPLMTVVLTFTNEHVDVPFAALFPALLLLFMAVATMGTITVAIASRLDMVANLSICTAIFFLGLISSYLFNNQSDSQLLNFINSSMYALLPNWQFFWLADALASQQQIPTSYVLWTLLYTLLYMLMCSIWAIVMFQNLELAKDSTN